MEDAGNGLAVIRYKLFLNAYYPLPIPHLK